MLFSLVFLFVLLDTENEETWSMMTFYIFTSVGTAEAKGYSELLLFFLPHFSDISIIKFVQGALKSVGVYGIVFAMLK